MLRGALYIVLGVVLGPIIWLLTKLRVLKPVPVLPKPIHDFSNYLWGQGLHASVSVQDVRVNHAECLAYFQFGLDPSKFRVMSVTYSATSEQAEQVEAEARGAPQFTAVRRNGVLVMACTFTPPDPDLEAKLESAFTRYSVAT